MVAFEDLPSLKRMAKDGGYWVIDEYGNREWVNLDFSNNPIYILDAKYDLIGNLK